MNSTLTLNSIRHEELTKLVCEEIDIYIDTTIRNEFADEDNTTYLSLRDTLKEHILSNMNIHKEVTNLVNLIIKDESFNLELEEIETNSILTSSKSELEVKFGHLSLSYIKLTSSARRRIVDLLLEHGNILSSQIKLMASLNENS